MAYVESRDIIVYHTNGDMCVKRIYGLPSVGKSSHIHTRFILTNRGLFIIEFDFQFFRPNLII